MERFVYSFYCQTSTMISLLSQTTAVLTSGLERIPDQLGYLVISEDGVLAVSVHIMFVYWIHTDRYVSRPRPVWLLSCHRL